MSSKITISRGKTPALLLQVKPATQVTTVLQKPPMVVADGTVGIGEAPLDGEQYARENAQWEIVKAPPGPVGPEGPQGEKGDAGASSSAFNYRVDAASIAPTDPGAGRFKYNNANQQAATLLYMDWLTTDDFDAHVLFQIMNIDDEILIQDTDLAVNYQIFKITGLAVQMPDWFQLPVQFVSSSGAGSFTNNQFVTFLVRSIGLQGPVGPPSFPDAPVNATLYERSNGGWVADPIQTDAPNNTNSYSRKGLAWVANAVQTDAPNDTLMYGRKSLGWARSVAVAGDTMTGNLAIQPTTGTAALVLVNAGGTNQNAIQACKGNTSTGLRWQMQLGDASAEAAGNVGSDFGIWRYDNNGTYLAQAMAINRATGAIDVFGRLGASGQIVSSAGGDAIRAASGNISTDQMLYAGTPGVRTIGPVNANGTLSAANGMGMYWDGNAGNYFCMGAGLGTPWSWEWNRSTGNLRWLGGGAGMLMTIGTGGRVTAADGFDSNDYLGVRCLGSTGDGSTYGYCALAQGTPTSWNLCHVRSWHQYGQWAGLQFYADGSNNTVQVVLSNAGGWGTLRAASFEVQSDVTTKQKIAPIASALDIIDGIKAYTYEFIPVAQTKGSGQIYGANRRHAGTMSQDWKTRLPEAVTDSGGGNLMYDPAATGAVTAQAVSELLQRVKALEARIAQLEGA